MDLFNRIRQAKAPSGLETGRGALAGGDDDDGGVDRRASGDGYAGLSEPSLVLYRRRKLSEEYPISRTDPFTSQYQELTPLHQGQRDRRRFEHAGAQ